MTDTIFALSSGTPPAAIAVIRISGPGAVPALTLLCGALPPPRQAGLRTLRHPATADQLDRALILWGEGPATATGEDVAEIHAHGGRAVVSAIESALATIPGLRRAQAGEFTRRAFDNGRLSLIEAEALADLLQAETESQRRQAMTLSGGALVRQVDHWQEKLLSIAAKVEAELDFSDEADVAGNDKINNIINDINDIAVEVSAWLARPPVERLRDGLCVAIAGPPNAGKSTLLNCLAGREAAITSPVAGTTRDIIEVPVALAGVPLRLADMAGLHGGTGDPIEAEGMARARSWMAGADLILWLGRPDQAPDHPCVCRIAAQCDRRAPADGVDITLSAVTGEGVATLNGWILEAARALLPVEGEVALNARHRAALSEAVIALSRGGGSDDLLLIAEDVRAARSAIDRITGRAGTDAMLDALFGRFCIGK